MRDTTTATRRAVLGRARRLAVGGATLVAGMMLFGTVSPAPTSAATGTWEIYNHRHFCGLGQEAGSDEFFLYTFWFKFQPGNPDSVRVGRTAIYEIDDIDDEEYHSIPADMGQVKFTDLHNFGLNPWTAGELALDHGPEIVGTVTQVMEADTASNSNRRSLADGVVNALRPELVAVARESGPFKLMGEAVTNALGDALAGQNMDARRSQDLQNYVTNATNRIVQGTVNKAGLWSSLRSIVDDPIGSPKIALFLSTDNFAASLIDPTLAAWNTDGNMFGSLRSRSWKAQYKGDGARYVLDVRTRQV